MKKEVSLCTICVALAESKQDCLIGYLFLELKSACAGFEEIKKRMKAKTMNNYVMEYQTVQIVVEGSNVWVNIPQCVLRIAGLNPKWIHKLAVPKWIEEKLAELIPQYKPSRAEIGGMIDIRIPEPQKIECERYDCIHNKFPAGICRSVPKLKIAKLGLLSCDNFKDCLG